MALIDTLGAAQRGATTGMQNYANWLANAQATNQLAANAVQSDMDAANQAARYKAGLRPAYTPAAPMNLKTDIRTPGGDVTQKDIQYYPVRDGQVSLPLYDAAPVPAGLTPPGAAPAPFRFPTALFAKYGDKFSKLPYKNQQEIRDALKATGGTEAEMTAVMEKYLTAPVAPAAPAAPAAGVVPTGKIPIGFADYYPNVDVFNPGPDASPLAAGAAGVGNALYNAPGDFKNVVENVFKKPFVDAYNYLTMKPSELNELYYRPGAVPAAAEPAAEPAAEAAPTAEETADLTPAERSGYETAVGLTPPLEGGEPADMSPVSLLTNPQARAKLSDADLDYRNTGIMDNRNLIIDMFNREVGNLQADAARNDQLRVQQYDALMQQAQSATTAGNTGYAQSLINKADALLQEASDAVTTQRQMMDTLQANAQGLLNSNETELLSNQAVIAEREFTVGNNPSRMLSMLEAYGFGGVNLEGMPNGKLRMALPTEGGGITYFTDQSGKPAEMTKQEFVSFFMGTLSEDIRARQIADQAASAASNLEFQRELEKISFQSYADVQKALAEKVDEGSYTVKYNPDTESYEWLPKSPELPMLIIKKEIGANGLEQYATTVVNATPGLR